MSQRRFSNTGLHVGLCNHATNALKIASMYIYKIELRLLCLPFSFHRKKVLHHLGVPRERKRSGPALTLIGTASIRLLKDFFVFILSPPEATFYIFRRTGGTGRHEGSPRGLSNLSPHNYTCPFELGHSGSPPAPTDYVDCIYNGDKADHKGYKADV